MTQDAAGAGCGGLVMHTPHPRDTWYTENRLLSPLPGGAPGHEKVQKLSVSAGLFWWQRAREIVFTWAWD